MILSIKKLRKHFGGIKAINDLDLCVKENSITGLIGPNGAGKTTLFNIIMGMYKPTRGTIFFCEKNIVGLRTYQIVNLGISRSFQIPKPFKSMTVQENIEVSLIPNKIFSRTSMGKIREKSIEMLKLVGLEHEKDQYPHSLPFASLNKLELAKALSVNPRLILLDEPFAGLTNLEMKEMSSIITNLKLNRSTVIIIDHNIRAIVKLVDYMFVIDFGKKLAEGYPDEVIRNESVIRAYLTGKGA